MINTKIILSRKGFDSAAGGFPSPLFIEEKRLVSMPIPEDNDYNIIDTGITYNDLIFDDEHSYSDVMYDLYRKDFRNRYVHLDPDVNYNILKNRCEYWRGIFGQCSSSQTHLSNHNVEPGDLFLFFGWFRDAKKVDGHYIFTGKNKQIIWGYLQVGEIEKIDQNREYDEWKHLHPHYYYKDRSNNTSYIANEKLSFNYSLPGCGVLNYDNSLVLTYDKQNNRSIWKLPAFFHPKYNTKVTYHENLKDCSGHDIWELHDDYTILHSAGRGQEFIITGNPKVEEWAKGLVENN